MHPDNEITAKDLNLTAEYENVKQISSKIKPVEFQANLFLNLALFVSRMP